MTSGRSLRLLVCAEEAAGVQLLRSLGRLPELRTVGVLTRLEAGSETATVASVAQAMSLSLLPSQLVRDGSFAAWIRDNEIDVLVNVHSLYVAHADVVRAPTIGSFNLHPGPLPRYAGLNAPSWAIFSGERSHGVTVHWMEPGIDTGPIAYQSQFDLGETDTGLTVSTRCVRLGVPLMLELLATATADPGSIPAIPQDLEARTYYGRGAPHGGRLRWSWPANEIDRFVRASDYFPLPSPWAHPMAKLGSRTVAIGAVGRTEETCFEHPGMLRAGREREAEVATGDEWLRLVRLSVDGEPIEPARLLDLGGTLEDG